jgi:hypothetical protein
MPRGKVQHKQLYLGLHSDYAFCSSGRSISYFSFLSDNVSVSKEATAKAESAPHSLWEFRQTVAKFKQVSQALSLKVYIISNPQDFQGIVN